MIEKSYRISTDRTSTAIAGLSMGGAESLYIGLNALDRFAWIGAFSSGGLDPNYKVVFPALDATANSNLRLLWISCGQDDSLLDSNERLVSWLQSQGIHLTWAETPGAHSWQVWRRNLINFLPPLFSKE